MAQQSLMARRRWCRAVKYPAC